MSTTATAMPPIRYRSEDGPGAASIVTALVGALVLLAITTAALAWAKRRGWLRAWVATSDGSDGAGLRVRARRRLSARTVIYEIDTDQGRVHVVESSARIVISKVAP